MRAEARGAPGMTRVHVKICGLTRPEDVAACAAAGAAYVGLNFFEKSPRYAAPALARELALETPAGIGKVGLVVDATDAVLEALLAEVPLDFLQLHGGETPERVAEVRTRFGLPVLKAIGIREAADLAQIGAYSDAADQLLVDAKAPKDAALPGGNGLAFDWTLLAGRKYWRTPWLLAGGLTPENVGEAIRRTGARQVDVSSGVESAPGVKDAARIAAFIAAANDPVPAL